ncbi:hypothetical protein MPER_10387 [Moniliophthora perniciosa FA553]|nr:hypothetical protein MPER_10387 [Moniliophthora perniciosa FA553]
MTKVLEDFALDTECWMHFSVQHPTCTQPFIHYTSPRLRTEGGALLDTIHEANFQLYGSLMTARRRDTSQIAAELAEAKAKLVEAEAQTKAKVAEVQAACADAEKASKAADAKLSEFQAAREAAEKESTQLIAALALTGIMIPGLTK